MSDDRLKENLIKALWNVVDRHEAIESATLTGSFVNSRSLAGLSDIDFVVILDELHQQRFTALQADFQAALQPVLRAAGYELLINPTLGPLKFNEPNLAVLHLMLYSRQAHVEHVINSPFTCLDWQDSPVYRKASLSEIYPAFGLQPRHFLSARRSISDYLADFRAAVVSYRELICDEHGYRERKCGKPMNDRDRHEFAYHVMRFLMINLLKLTRRFDGTSGQLEALMDRFFATFPQGAEDARPLLALLAQKKRTSDFATAIPHLDTRLEAFIAAFEHQFKEHFVHQASRHLVFRHAPTADNLGPTKFLGRTDVPILTAEASADERDWSDLRSAVEALNPGRAFASPLLRCQQSLHKVAPGLSFELDSRLIEINYGQCERLTVGESRERFPELFEAWERQEDPPFPGGENSADVLARSLGFVNQHWTHDAPHSITCSHNGVLRGLIGEALGIPASLRHKLQVPHLAPTEFVATRQFGVFVNLTEAVERQLFQKFGGGCPELKLST